jgi:hypothetical protein
MPAGFEYDGGVGPLSHCGGSVAGLGTSIQRQNGLVNSTVASQQPVRAAGNRPVAGIRGSALIGVRDRQEPGPVGQRVQRPGRHQGYWMVTGARR